MNLSSRWCVTAVVALSALACSDPVPPASQGAFIASVRSVSPAPVGKMCPSGAALTFDVPKVNDTTPADDLDGDTYLHKIIDGEDSSQVSCSVKGKSSFTFGGRIELGARAIEISNGTIDGSMKGTARITLTNSGMPGFSHSLSAPSANCVIDASSATAGGLQIKAGSMWAAFSCPSVEAQPSDYCKADGFFVLENCSQ